MRKTKNSILTVVLLICASLIPLTVNSQEEECDNCEDPMVSCEVTVDCGNGYAVTVVASTCSNAYATARAICAQM